VSERPSSRYIRKIGIATAIGGIYGYSHSTGGFDGGQAELVRVPFADVGEAFRLARTGEALKVVIDF
jgi:threonine dehydrogenase-like Zn-dependent dehydrogenase